MTPADHPQIMRPFAALLAPAIILLALWTSDSTGAEYYQWTDENGIMHVSNMPPEESPKKPRQVKTTRIQDPGSDSGITVRSGPSGPAPGAAPVGAAPGVQPPSTATLPATPAATAPGTPGPARSSGSSASKPASASASQTGSGAVSPAEPFRSQSPPDDPGRERESSTRGAANPRYQ